MESALFDRQYESYDYNGLLFVRDAGTANVRSFLATSEFEPAKFDGHSIEIIYSGRDANRWLVSWMKRLAEVVRNATGEITCTVTTDEGDPLFEFFRIADGRLIRQRGRIERGESEVVS